MTALFGGPVVEFPAQQTYATQAKGWADRMLDIIVGAFGNTGTAIIAVLFFAFILWTRLRPKT